ncbi:helix-turn-helix domain-containing protein [Clostridioides difficile]|nr:helix-turn-helix domain-containing protein [Clostridioides difficile]
MLKVSRQTISSIENGKYNPSLELAFQISDFLKCRLKKSFYGRRYNLWKKGI